MWGDMMKQALRVAFGFLMLWAASARRSPYREITCGWTFGATDWRCAFNGPGRALRLKIMAGIVRQIYAIAVTTRQTGPDVAKPATAQEVQPTAWSALGIDAVVVGQVTPNPDGSYNAALSAGWTLAARRLYWRKTLIK